MPEKQFSIITYNLNGIRSALKKGFLEWLAGANYDIVCMQEVKAEKSDVDILAFEKMGYNIFWNSAEKKGYSGTAVFTKIKPDDFSTGIGIDDYDKEGRLIRLDFGNITLLNAYFPSGSSGEIRQAVKMRWLDDFFKYLQKLKKKRNKIILSGDYNICHKPIDIHNPVSNANSSGFLPEERAWMDKFFESGFIDTFRHFNQEPHQYSWWSFRFNSRANNKGWRIDYNNVSENLKKSIKGAEILPQIKHSDHCPVKLKIIF